MRRIALFPAGLAILLASSALAGTPAPQPTPEQKAFAQKLNALPWASAPVVPITERAKLKLDPAVRALDAGGTDELLKLTGNLPEKNSYAVAAKNGNWFAIYSFDEIGYVKDDDKIDADALLKTLRENQEAANSERTAQGLGPLTVIGWAVPPHYDPTTHNLEYGVTLGSGGTSNVNYHLRMLGRRGVMDATLITSPEYLKEDLADFRAANRTFAFNAEEGYGAYKEGDKVSEYGLAALVTGGAAAAALKGGLLKGVFAALAAFWKVIAVGVAAFFAAIRRFFKKGEDLGPPPAES